MTFKGDKIIGKPTFAMIEIFVAEKGLFCEAKDAYDYWENKEWANNRGEEVATLESAICSYNGIAVNKAIKKASKSLGITKLSKRAKEIEKRSLRKRLLSGDKDLENMIKLEMLGSGKKKEKEAKKSERISYDEQLKDKKWLSFRKFVLDVRGRKCENCGKTKNLQIHHPKYKPGHMAWEYTCNEVMVLCGECHMKTHGIEK